MIHIRPSLTIVSLFVFLPIVSAQIIYAASFVQRFGFSPPFSQKVWSRKCSLFFFLGDGGGGVQNMFLSHSWIFPRPKTAWCSQVNCFWRYGTQRTKEGIKLSDHRNTQTTGQPCFSTRWQFTNTVSYLGISSFLDVINTAFCWLVAEHWTSTQKRDWNHNLFCMTFTHEKTLDNTFTHFANFLCFFARGDFFRSVFCIKSWSGGGIGEWVSEWVGHTIQLYCETDDEVLWHTRNANFIL